MHKRYYNNGTSVDLAISKGISVADIQITVDLDYVSRSMGLRLTEEQEEEFLEVLKDLPEVLEGVIREYVRDSLINGG